jgi:DNA-directed RNA polymerase subunit M/transcription elongation factor TFIIS
MHETKRKPKEIPRCSKCGEIMLSKRSNATQCTKCRRKQQDEISYEIKKKKRKVESLNSSLKKAKKTGAEDRIKENTLLTLEACIENEKNPTEEDLNFLKQETLYNFEKEFLPKEAQDKELKKLSETDFKFIFDAIKRK